MRTRRLLLYQLQIHNLLLSSLIESLPRHLPIAILLATLERYTEGTVFQSPIIHHIISIWEDIRIPCLSGELFRRMQATDNRIRRLPINNNMRSREVRLAKSQRLLSFPSWKPHLRRVALGRKLRQQKAA